VHCALVERIEALALELGALGTDAEQRGAEHLSGNKPTKTNNKERREKKSFFFSSVFGAVKTTTTPSAEIEQKITPIA
jgi:hypothetical protein